MGTVVRTISASMALPHWQLIDSQELNLIGIILGEKQQLAVIGGVQLTREATHGDRSVHGIAAVVDEGGIDYCQRLPPSASESTGVRYYDAPALIDHGNAHRCIADGHGCDQGVIRVAYERPGVEDQQGIARPGGHVEPITLLR